MFHASLELDNSKQISVLGKLTYWFWFPGQTAQQTEAVPARVRIRICLLSL